MIKFFHYDISEHQLFQQELDKIGQQGYTTSNVSNITFFKKTDKPVYYAVDIFLSHNSSITGKRREKDVFNDYYFERGYEQVSSLRKIVVYRGDHRVERREPPKIDNRTLGNKSLRLFLSFLLLFAYFIVFIMPLKAYHLTTNSKILLYVAAFLLVLAILYRSTIKWNLSYQMSETNTKRKPLKVQYQKIMYMISTIMFVASIALIVFSLVFDFFQYHETTDIPDNIVQLADFDIEDESEYSYMHTSSLMVRNYYEYIENTTDYETALFIKHYEFRNESDAQDLIDSLMDGEDDVDNYEHLESGYVGYTKEETYVVILQDEGSVTYINTSFDLNPYLKQLMG